MNLNELFKPQDELDKRIVVEHKLEGQDLLKKKTVALLTELYECINNARFFKFWSKDQKPRTELLIECEWCGGSGRDYSGYCVNCQGGYVGKRNPLLEEYVDTIHFAVSIANDLGYQEHKYIDPGDYDLNDLTIGFTNLISMIPSFKSHRHISTVFNYLIKLGYSLGFDEETVLQAYYVKNSVNHERQNTGY